MSTYHHDPGWNDPPIFTYDTATAIQNAASSKKGISLNKRVAFPISGNIASGPTQGNSQLNSSPGINQPPPPTLPPSLSYTGLPSTSPVASDLGQTNVTVGKDKLEEVLKNLQISSITNEDILKRIGLMEKMWTEEKLDGSVRMKILQLSEALANNNTDLADHLQKSLMVDNVSQCSSWMSGIRHLINMKRVAQT
ncbi:hypothetical protein RUM44_013162 [Polyplax serrata]|uniref:SRA1/Sec31 domain-containing protein n=1 Tax=Polyplax serrata TaxID=468196 RepID=A0ABR1BH11_POLSC